MVVDREKDNPQLRRAALDGGARWGHDMFAQVEPAAGRGPSAAGDDPRAPSSLGTKIFVANLDFKVESEDVKELFSTCGEVVSGRVHFLRGRKAGTGEAIFKERSAAVEAMKYNGVQLDGRPMELELIEQAAPDEGVRTLKSGRRVGGEPKLVAKTRLFEQAAAGVRQPRGRGSVRMGKDAMQE
jgi:RNA recognition motif-containing protein